VFGQSFDSPALLVHLPFLMAALQTKENEKTGQTKKALESWQWPKGV
jgi:hypothetical protein